MFARDRSSDEATRSVLKDDKKARQATQSARRKDAAFSQGTAADEKRLQAVTTLGNADGSFISTGCRNCIVQLLKPSMGGGNRT